MLTTLYTFSTDGANPYARLAQGSNGALYGTTWDGGAGNFGTVFKLTLDTALATFYSFGSAGKGANPTSGLVQGRDGYFYGTTEYGGTNGMLPWIIKTRPWGRFDAASWLVGFQSAASVAHGDCQFVDCRTYPFTPGFNRAPANSAAHENVEGRRKQKHGNLRN